MRYRISIDTDDTFTDADSILAHRQGGKLRPLGTVTPPRDRKPA
jgi:hypothetical protein